MILVDFSQVALAAMYVSLKDFDEGDQIDESAVRNIVLGSLVHLRTKFHEKFGELVICCDGAHTWRRDVFPYYKFKRKESRAESPLDWDAIFSAINNIRSDLDTVFPYKVVHVDKAEADDAIAVLCKAFSPIEPCLVVSTDKDFVQLLMLGDNVKIYSPRTNEFITNKRPDHFRAELILRGDSGDGVPSVLSQDDCFVLKIRQKPMTQKRLEPLMECLLLGKPVPSEFQKNVERNTTLIDLLYSIPADIETAIKDAYQNAHVGKRSNLLSYFIKHKLVNLSNRIQNF